MWPSRFQKILRLFFEGHTNVSDHFRTFMKVNEVFRRRRRKFRRCLNLLTRRNSLTNQFYAVLVIFSAPKRGGRAARPRQIFVSGGYSSPAPLTSHHQRRRSCQWRKQRPWHVWPDNFVELNESIGALYKINLCHKKHGEFVQTCFFFYFIFIKKWNPSPVHESHPI